MWRSIVEVVYHSTTCLQQTSQCDPINKLCRFFQYTQKSQCPRLLPQINRRPKGHLQMRKRSQRKVGKDMNEKGWVLYGGTLETVFLLWK